MGRDQYGNETAPSLGDLDRERRKGLRRFEAVPEPGELVVSRDEGGARHFLDGYPVHCGTELRLGARLVRYESAGPISESSAMIYFDDEANTKRAATRQDRFRWPQKRRPAR